MSFNHNQLNLTKNGLNVVRILAKMGKIEAVNQLLTSGGKIEDAVYGYALGGYVDEVNHILEIHPLLLIFAAAGYTRADNDTEIEKLLSNDETSIKQALVQGYSQAGNKNQIKAASKSQNDYLTVIVNALAECGHNELALQYAISNELQNIAIQAAACSGNSTLVNEILSRRTIDLEQIKIPLKPDAIIPLSHALVGYSKGRHFEQIEPLLKLNINPMLCLTAIADNGTIHGSDIQALFAQIKEVELKNSLANLINEQFGIDCDSLVNEDFSSNLELENLFENEQKLQSSVALT